MNRNQSARLLETPREYCEWIANPGYHRCPKLKRTGMDCLCQTSTSSEDAAGWPWRVVPPKATEPDKRCYIYDEDGPIPVGTLREYEASRRGRKGRK